MWGFSFFYCNAQSGIIAVFDLFKSIVVLRYYLNSGRDAVIQNCTIEWGGNTILNVESAEPTNDYFSLATAFTVWSIM